MKTKLIYRRANVQRTTDIRFVLDVEASEGLTPIRVTLQNGTAVTKHVLAWHDGTVRQTPPRDLYISAAQAVGVTSVERSGPMDTVISKAAPTPEAQAPGFTPEQMAKIQALMASGLI